MCCTCSATHQHPLQTAQVVLLSLSVHFLEADSMPQPYELITDIYSLEVEEYQFYVCAIAD